MRILSLAGLTCAAGIMVSCVKRDYKNDDKPPPLKTEVPQNQDGNQNTTGGTTTGGTTTGGTTTGGTTTGGTTTGGTTTGGTTTGGTTTGGTRALKDTAGFAFYRFASPTEGCVPVLTRTVGFLRGNLTNTRDKPIFFGAAEQDVLGYAKWSFENEAGITLLSFKRLNTWVRSSIAEKILIDDGSVASASLDDVCAKKLSIVKASGFYAFLDDYPYSQYTDRKAPLRMVNSYIPDAKFTYRTTIGSEYLDMRIGLDSAALNKLGPFGNLVGCRSADWAIATTLGASTIGFLSDWQTLPLDEFLSGNASIKVGSLATRAIHHFQNLKVFFRLSGCPAGGDRVTRSIVWLDVGDLCREAYYAQDGTPRPEGNYALYHKALFDDLTHPEWNDRPSLKEKTGCAFVGGEQ